MYTHPARCLVTRRQQVMHERLSNTENIQPVLWTGCVQCTFRPEKRRV